VRLRADDARHEMRLAAGWARRILEQRPEARIGIVAPDLAARRSALASALGKTLDPAALAPGAPTAPRPWNISLGPTAGQLPGGGDRVAPAGVDAAAGRRRIAGHAAAFAALGAAAGAGGTPRRARPARPAGPAHPQPRRRADAVVEPVVPGGRPRPKRRRARGQALAFRPLSARLGSAARGRPRTARPRRLRRLGRRFSGWLKAAGWSGACSSGRPLDSHEFQAVDAWNALLSRFSGLSDFAGTLRAGEALALLGRLAGETLFQPRSGDAPVQVLGLYEATGQSFEHLWVMGLHDGAWPPAAAPDPFIPLGLQREHRLPHSGPDVELEWAREVTAALRASAAEVVFSYPGRDGNEALTCSPLIAGPGGVRRRRHSSIARTTAGRKPCAAPPCPSPCPQPYSRRRRSRLRNPEAARRQPAARRPGGLPVPGVRQPSAGRRAAGAAAGRAGREAQGRPAAHGAGTPVATLQSQSNLLAMPGDALTDLLRATIGEVLEEQRRRSPAAFTPRLAAVEAQRLEQRVLAWLELERQRSPFTVIACEQQRQLRGRRPAAGLKIDRIDRLADGSLVVLDYKTGQVKPAAWFGERPEEPQLPLYGVVSRAGSSDDGAAAERC
jgi:ATP-dependent helicase/nuclease subunit B